MNAPENAYDFVTNDEDEVMLLLYARESTPKNAVITIDLEKRSAVLHRNETEKLTMEDIPAEVLDSLQDADTLMICELSREENEAETKIINAYEADIEM